MSTDNLTLLVDRYLKLKEEHQVLKENAASVWQEMGKVEAELVESMAENGVQSITQRDRAVSMREVTNYKLPPKPVTASAFAEWVGRTKGASVLQELLSISSQVYNSFIKQELKDNPGIEIPGIGQPNTIIKLSVRKTK